MKEALGHDDRCHGRPPFVNFIENNGFVEFEVELYTPFKDLECFQVVAEVLRQTVLDILEQPWESVSRRCFRPKIVQVDDWECPNIKCGNLCFSKRRVCQLCGSPKPQLNEPITPQVKRTVEDKDVEGKSQLPKHKVKLVSTRDRLGEPKPGETQVNWLVPLDRRGLVIGKAGAHLNWMKEETGIVVLVCDVVEVVDVFGVQHCPVFIRGNLAKVRKAKELVVEQGWGRLAEDSLHPLLDIVVQAMEGLAADPVSQGWVLLSDLDADAAVQLALEQVRPRLAAAGLCSLLEALELWPERFDLIRHSPTGPAVRNLDRCPDMLTRPKSQTRPPKQDSNKKLSSKPKEDEESATAADIDVWRCLGLQ